MIVGQHRHAVGADLIGKVPVGRHPVAAQEHQVDLPLGHQAGGHVVGDEGGGDAVLHQLPGGEPGPL